MQRPEVWVGERVWVEDSPSCPWTEGKMEDLHIENIKSWNLGLFLLGQDMILCMCWGKQAREGQVKIQSRVNNWCSRKWGWPWSPKFRERGEHPYYEQRDDKGCSSMVKSLPGMRRAFGSIPSTREKEKWNRRKVGIAFGGWKCRLVSRVLT